MILESSSLSEAEWASSCIKMKRGEKLIGTLTRFLYVENFALKIF